MASLRDIRRRITSVKNTRQITRAMKMVAGAKLKRAQERATASQPYKNALVRVLGRVSASAGDVQHPLLSSHAQVRRLLLVVFTSDRGLCGAFNNNLLRQTEAWIVEQERRGVKVTLITYGKKARTYFNARGRSIAQAFVDIGVSRYGEQVIEITDRMTRAFTQDRRQGEGEAFEEVHIVFNHFRSVMNQIPTFSQLLPLRLDSANTAAGGSADYLYEPDGQELLNTLLPLYLQTLIYQAFFESEAGEHAARMAAMDSATRNASELIGNLTLQYNRARQAAITKELIEIVSGAEAV